MFTGNGLLGNYTRYPEQEANMLHWKYANAVLSIPAYKTGDFVSLAERSNLNYFRLNSNKRTLLENVSF